VLPPRLRSLTKPRFLAGEQKLTGAERGTAIHLALQYLDFSEQGGEAGIRAQLETMCAQRKLTDEQAEAVDVRALMRFLQSPLAARIRASERVEREYRFSLLTDAGLYDPAAAGEEMLLQGVADCVFETADGLTVVDFKTDRVTAEEALRRAEVYRTQLNAYAGALAKILQKPVTERVLYFFACDREISL
ncbi:MAG TPA: helicase-exonuclease AddAB subunit AddA, partial [Oscillibacter sp.]|nr:helicase-exonuclease AddAB subunit AddA [Oscillibacter sp.]